MSRTLAFSAALSIALSFLVPSAVEARKEKYRFGKVGVMHRQFVPPEPYDWRGAKTHALVTDIWYPVDPTAVEKEQWALCPSWESRSGRRDHRGAR
jgi:hypothetical protein